MSAAQELAPVTITIWEALTRTTGRRLVGTWDHVLDLPEWASPAVLEEKNAGRGWSPATFTGDRRDKKSVESVCALVLDYEAPADQLPTTPEDASALWGAWSGWIYTTWSHTPERPRFRLVVTLSRPVTAAEYPLLWRWAATRCEEVGHHIDEACRDASRLWYLPAVRPGHLHEYRLLPLHGAADLDVDAVLAEQRAKEAPPPPAPRKARKSQPTEDGAARYCRKALDGALEDIRLAPKGTRHNVIRVKAYHLAGLIHTGALSADEIERELMAEAERAGWDQLDKTRVTVRYQIKAGERAPKDLPEPRAAYRASSSEGPRATDEPPASGDGGGEGGDGEEDWQSVLIRRRGEITSDLANIVAILAHDDAWRGRIRYNEARQQIETDDTGWRPWADTDDTEAAVWMQRQWGLRVRPEAVCQAVGLLSRQQRANPLAIHLDGLQWGGVPRLDRWLTTYAGAADTDYTRAVGACWLRSAVARALRPGVKADAALVLEGAQGAGKSSLLGVIGGDYFTDDIHDLSSKDAALAISRAWIVELPELSALGRAEVELIKAFLSRTVDRFRPPYGRALVELPRRCVFGGTTNRSDYLRDDTGNRRFWPVRVGAVDLDALRRDRDQLLAEAVATWRGGAGLVLPAEVRGGHAEIVEGRRQEDPWEEDIARYLAQKTSVTSGDVLSALNIPTERRTRGDQMRAGQVLARLGWRKKRKRVGTAFEWRYEKGDDDVPT